MMDTDVVANLLARQSHVATLSPRERESSR